MSRFWTAKHELVFICYRLPAELATVSAGFEKFLLEVEGRELGMEVRNP